jgi:hypothetical protein
MEIRLNATREEINLASDHADELIERYNWLGLHSVLARLLTQTYRNPPGRPGPEIRDGVVVSDDVAREALQLYSEIYTAARKMQNLVDFPRKLLARVVDYPARTGLKDVNNGYNAILASPPLAAPRSHASAWLLAKAYIFARYILLLTRSPIRRPDASPIAEAQRMFFGDVLALTGWEFNKAEIDAAWAMAAASTYGELAKPASLRLSREERAELTEWYIARGIA